LKKILILCWLASLCTDQTQAQSCPSINRFGIIVQAGAGTLFNQANASLMYTYTPGISFALGGYYNILLSNYFGLEPSLMYRSMNWTEKLKTEGEPVESTVRGNYLSVPINFQIFISPVFRFNIGPEAAYLLSIKSTEIPTESGNPFDFSGNAGFDIRNGQYRFGLNYNRSFTDFYNIKVSDSEKTGRNTGLFLTIRMEY
jgi:hypothetical protein